MANQNISNYKNVKKILISIVLDVHLLILNSINSLDH